MPVFKGNSVTNFAFPASVLDVLGSEKHCVFFVSDLVETQPNTVGRLAALKALAHLESDIGLLQLGR